MEEAAVLVCTFNRVCTKVCTNNKKQRRNFTFRRCFLVVPVMGVEPSPVGSLCANLTVQRAVTAQLLRILQALAAPKIKSVYLLCVLWVSSTDDSGENFIQLGGVKAGHAGTRVEQPKINLTFRRGFRPRHFLFALPRQG